MSTAPVGFGDPPPHVAQRSRRDKLRFPPAADVMLPPPYDDAADLGYLHAVVAPPPPPPPAPTDHWLASQYVDALAPWARAKLLEHDEARGFTTQPAAVLSLTLSPAPQELPPAYGGSLQSVVGAAAGAVRPLGPFTGYAAVLKGSLFLRPAQQLLDEICAALVGAEATSGSAGAVGGSSSLASPSSLSSSTDTGDRQHQRPEFREKKAKLLNIQEEVCRRYKQYHQQMQMVVSSFESVPGQSCATPYASSVLRAISRHFRCVRSIISSQIQHTSRLLGEELLSLPSCSSGGRAAARSSGLTDQISQPVWRPQRGLPERAVSVLRAWLFDHFLHPYPTDADKHMLATQTGLSRNQVSNWFINARVRLWKPMVEEIYMLETRGSANTNASSDRSNPGAALSNHTAGPLPPLPSPVAVGGGHHRQQQQMLGQYLDAAPPPMDIQVGGGGQVMMSFGPAADMGGFGAVSLTLGLRRDVSYHQQQFGCGHILGDLVG